MSDQVTAPASKDAGVDLVWAKSPATGRKKEMPAAKLAVLALAGWMECEPPGDEEGHLVVQPFPAGPSEEAAQQPGQGEAPPAEGGATESAGAGDAEQQKMSRSGRRVAAEQEGS